MIKLLLKLCDSSYKVNPKYLVLKKNCSNIQLQLHLYTYNNDFNIHYIRFKKKKHYFEKTPIDFIHESFKSDDFSGKTLVLFR